MIILSWFDVIKMVELMTESSVSKIYPNFKTATERGYPSIINPLTLVVKKVGEELGAFTSFSDMGKFYFVGSGFSNPKYEGQGHFRQVRESRDDYTKGKPRITLLNPIDEKSREMVFRMARKNGEEVISYEQVKDIMTEQEYGAMSILPMFRYGVL